MLLGRTSFINAIKILVQTSDHRGSETTVSHLFINYESTLNLNSV